MVNRVVLNETSYFGRGSRKKLKDELLSRGYSKILLVSDITLEEAKVTSMVSDVLDNAGITYFKYRKNNSKAKEINEAASKYHWNEIKEMFLDKFTAKEIKYYENIGCPLPAIWYQDQNMQLAYYHTVKDFAKSKGIEMEIVSRLD